jgi:hypothetical protein
MELSQVSIFIGGILTITMAVFHCTFYRLFGWGKDLPKISIKNSKILYTIHVGVILLFFCLGSFSIIFYKEMSLPNSPTGYLALILALFWLWRALWQVIYFPPKAIPNKKSLYLYCFLVVYFLLLFLAYIIPHFIFWLV